MAIRTIIEMGDPALRKVCRPVEKFNERLWTLLDDMAETMIDANGVGLAGPQVGILRRVVVVWRGEDDIIEMINPEITFFEGEQTGVEGCLSVPGEYGVVTRPMHVRAKFQDRYGEWQEVDETELTARAICHELDHLQGVLFVDNVSKMLTEEELEELERRKGDA